MFRHTLRQGLRQHQTLVRERSVCLHGLRQHHTLVRTGGAGWAVTKGLSQHQTLVGEEGVCSFTASVTASVSTKHSFRCCRDRASSVIFNSPCRCCRPHSPEPIICAEPRPAAPTAAAATRTRPWNRGSVPRSSAWRLGALLKKKEKEHQRDLPGTGAEGSATKQQRYQKGASPCSTVRESEAGRAAVGQQV